LHKRVRIRCSSFLLVSLLGVGCGGDDDQQSLDRFFDPQPDYGKTACLTRDDTLAGRRELRLFFNGRSDVEGATRGLARYYQRHGLSFFTASEPQPIAAAFAIDTDTKALGRELARAFPGVDFTNGAAVMADPVLWSQVLDATVNFMLRPMIDFAQAQGTVGSATTNLVLVPQIERPGGERLTPVGQEIAGLAISPTLLAVFSRADSPEGEIWRGVNLPGDFTPMMFLGSNVLRELAAAHSDLRELVVAHEFGHTNALVHRSEGQNLMNPGLSPGQNDCQDALADDQLATMRANLQLGGAGQTLLVSDHPASVRPDEVVDAIPFSPADLRDLLDGDRRAIRRLLGPFLLQH
jgi:hypothetical protein